MISIADVVDELLKYRVSLVEITGGEPLLQDATPRLIKSLIEHNFTVLLETNGSLSTAAIDPRVHLIIDVKTPGSMMVTSFNHDNLARLQPHHQLKFVLVDEGDFFWSLEFVNKYLAETGPLEIIFSPVTTSFDPAALAELMLEHRVKARLQLQLHTRIWPEDSRGR
jgi:7-carboxy-7-deazaguanine synthase